MLSWIKRLLLLCWFGSLLLLGAWIYADNDVAVALTLFGFEFSAQKLGVLVCVVFALGMISGFATSYLLTRGKLFMQQRRYAKVNKEVSKLRALSSSS